MITAGLREGLRRLATSHGSTRPAAPSEQSLGERSFARLCASAKVKRITFHGLRHTSATLLLAAGEPVHIVSERLGHSDVSITLNVYAHVLKTHQKGAAERIGALLHG